MRLLFILLLMGMEMFPTDVSGGNPGQKPLRFDHLNESLGLSNNVVVAIHKDKRGFMWFGTGDGLSKYDGSDFKTYRHIPGDSTSLFNSTISSISEDEQSNLWIGHRGMSCFNPFSGKAANFSTDNSLKNSLHYNNDHSALFDKDGNTWIVDIDALVRIDRKNGMMERIKPFPDAGVFPMTIDKGKLWYSSGAVLKSYSIVTKEVKNYPLQFPATPATFIRKFTATAWATNRWQEGVILFDPDRLISHQLLKGKIVNDIQIVRAGDRRQLWIATRDGLYTSDVGSDIFALRDEDFSLYRNDPGDIASISSDNINCIYQDTLGENIIWLGTDQGIDRINPNSYHFTEHIIRKNGNRMITSDLTNIFTERIAGNKLIHWLSYWNGTGLLKTDQDFNVLDQIQVLSKNGRSDIVSHAIRDHEGKMWISGFDGVIRYDDQKKLIIQKLGKKEGLTGRRCTYIYEDSRYRIWIATYNHELHRYDAASGKMDVIRSNGGPNSLISNKTDYILQDRRGNIWIAAYGLHRYREATHDFKVYPSNPEQHGGLPGRVIQIFEDHQGRIWVATDQGVAMLNEKIDSFRVYSTLQGLGSDLTFALAEDNEHNIWVSTLSGLSCINPEKNSIRNYTTADGLPNNQLGYIIERGLNGEMFFSMNYSNSALISFSPSRFSIQGEVIPFYFTSLSTLGKEWTSNVPLTRKSQVHLGYKENLFSISFKALDYTRSQGIRYRYKMDGLSEKWIDLGKVSTITFSNLAGGAYMLHVKASNTMGEWMNNDLLLQISIDKPYWESWWFRILILVTLSGLGYLIYRYRLREALKVIRLRASISTDLHDDIGSTLSSISILSDMMMSERISPDFSRHEMAAEIRDSSLELMDKMDDIVWSINPDKDSLEELMIRIQRFTRQILEAKGIECDIFIQENIGQLKIPMKMRQHIYLIMKEAVNNMVKYSDATLGSLEVSYGSGVLFIRIEDNGKGFDTEAASFGNGLSSMQNRALAINASLDIVSGTGNGTSITLHIKI